MGAMGVHPLAWLLHIDFRLAKSESAAEWEQLLSDLYHRGLTGARLEMVCVDGGQELLAALPTVFPGIPVQRCWADIAGRDPHFQRGAGSPSGQLPIRFYRVSDEEMAPSSLTR